MIRRLRFGLLAVLIGGGLVVAAVPAHAGTGVELLVARKTSGPFKAEIRRTVPLGAKRDVYI